MKRERNGGELFRILTRTSYLSCEVKALMGAEELITRHGIDIIKLEFAPM